MPYIGVFLVEIWLRFGHGKWSEPLGLQFHIAKTSKFFRGTFSLFVPFYPLDHAEDLEQRATSSRRHQAHKLSDRGKRTRLNTLEERLRQTRQHYQEALKREGETLMSTGGV